jgi:hypothetical protein
LVEDKDTEIQAASQNSIQKVNAEIKNLWEQLVARHSNDSAIPNQVLPVTAVDVENSRQSISELATSAVTLVMLIIVLRPCVATLHHNLVLTVLQDLVL